MASKFKLLITMSVLTGIGMVSILSIWLYGSYTNRLELFLSSAERSMFNIVQEVYQAHSNDLKNDQGGALGELRKKLRNKYSDTEIDSLFTELVSYHKHPRASRAGAKMGSGGRTKDGTTKGEIMTPSLFLQIQSTPAIIEEIKNKFDLAIQNKGIASSYVITTHIFPRESLFAIRKDYREKKLSWTRPMMIDAANSQFLVVKFKDVWKDLLFDLGWQLGIAILLVTIFIGSISYLFKTIFRQNRLAEMQKAFVNNMTHELKTPVSTVMTAIEAIQLYGGRHDYAKMDRYLSISRDQLDHLSDMIDRVLQMDVDERNGLLLEWSQVDLIQILENAADTFQINVNKEVTITVDSDAVELYIRADGSHIRNVVNNLLENAVKYSGDQVAIHIHVRAYREHIAFSISDKGKGIALIYQQDIFSLFFRVPEGNLHQVKGFGIGLAYVRQVIRQHGGEIKVKSIPNKGSTFTITLPK